MKLHSRSSRGITLVEMMVTTALIGVLGLVVFSLLNIGMVLGAKNTAVNTAHQQARTAMLQMAQDFHSAVSLPFLVDTSGNPVAGAGPAAGISFQEWTMGPYRIQLDVAVGANFVQCQVPAGTTVPDPTIRKLRLVVPTHQIEDDITALLKGSGGKLNITTAHAIPVPITGTSSYHIVCFITDRCSYTVINGAMVWQGPTVKKAFSVMGSNITNPTPFTTPLTPAGALYYRFIAAIDLSTADLTYSNRGFKSANILLNGDVPMRARLTTYQ